MRYVCCSIVVMVLLMCVAGCETATLTTRSYSLGPKPKAALVIIDQITMRQIERHGKEIMRDTPIGAKKAIVNVIEEEEIVVVQTTREGHRQIKVALQDLQK